MAFDAFIQIEHIKKVTIAVSRTRERIGQILYEITEGQ